jgi:hypothetical protein
MKPKMQNEERKGGKLKPKCYIITELTFKKKIPKIVEKNLMTFWWLKRACVHRCVFQELLNVFLQLKGSN